MDLIYEYPIFKRIAVIDNDASVYDISVSCGHHAACSITGC